MEQIHRKNEDMQYIFIHGLGQNPSSWDKTSDCLHHEIQIRFPNLVSFLADQEMTYHNLYQAFQDDCKMVEHPFHLCGLSLGAILALNYAIDYPEKVKSLILIAPQYKMPRFVLNVQSVMFRLMPDKFFEMMGWSKKNIIHLTRSMLHLDFSKMIDRILCPTLVICGKRDYVNKKAAKWLANKLSSAAYCEIETVGHEVNREAPELLAQVMMDFYNSNMFTYVKHKWQSK